MATLAKGFRGYCSEVPVINDWALQIGNFMINFGAVEMQTYLWLEALSEDENEIVNASKQQFSTRMQRLVKLVKAKKFDADIENQIFKIWDCSDELSKFRNKIAHNPLAFSYKEREAEGTPDYIGIPVFRKAKKDNTPFETLTLCSLEKLKLAVEATKENVFNLQEYYDEHLKLSK